MAGDLKRDSKEDLLFSEKVKSIVWEDPSISAKFSPYLKDEKALIIPKWRKI